MADISREQAAWKSAVYGEDVRDAEIALNEKMNTEVEAGTARIDEYGRKETARDTAEKGRANAETARVTEFNSLKKASETATGSANASASNANSKATAANNAAGSANMAATAANNAATSAVAAKEAADTATSGANSAKDAANTAASNANSKATIANNAAANADSKATLANSATISANTAADRANAAAKDAEDIVVGTGIVLTKEKGAANGVATLDTNKRIPDSQLGNVTKTMVGLGNVPNVATNDQTPTYTQASVRENLISGEKLGNALGKIKKWFADLKAVAFSGSYRDLSDKPTLGASASQDVANNVTTTTAGSVMDARQGKMLDEKKINFTDIINNFTTTVAGKVADARALKVLKDELDELNRNLQPTIIFSGSRDIKQAGTWSDTDAFSNYKTLRFTIGFQSQTCVMWIKTFNDDSIIHALSTVFNGTDGAIRTICGRIKFDGRYISTAEFKMSYNFLTPETLGIGNVYVLEIAGFRY